jgi:hypothetical protein
LSRQFVAVGLVGVGLAGCINRKTDRCVDQVAPVFSAGQRRAGHPTSDALGDDASGALVILELPTIAHAMEVDAQDKWFELSGHCAQHVIRHRDGRADLELIEAADEVLLW